MFLAVWGEEAMGLLTPMAPFGGGDFSSKALKNLQLIGTLFTFRMQAMHHGSLMYWNSACESSNGIYLSVQKVPRAPRSC